MPKPKVALLGYATVDFIARAVAPILPEGTNLIERSADGWPRAGGAPLYAGQALAERGCAVTPVVSVGHDWAGRLYLDHLRASGLSTGGIATQGTARTPVCMLIHQADGGYCCFLDRGDDADAKLSPTQIATIRDAQWVVIAAGHSGMADEALDLLQDGQALAWIVKADAVSFPTDLRRKLHARARVIVYNRHERDFLLDLPADEQPPCQILFETDGERGVQVHRQGQTTTIATVMLTAMDSTGAGDTFAGGALSVLLRDIDAVEQAAQTGLAAATHLLEQRAG